MSLPLILMVDDDVVDRQAIRRAIEDSTLAVELTEVTTADEAFAAMARQTFNCLLFDHDRSRCRSSTAPEVCLTAA